MTDNMQDKHNEKKRIQCLDIGRGIAILLVILGHIGMKENIQNFIYSFHIPCFFILAGMTSDFENYGHYRRNNVSLLVSYFFWSAIFLLYDLFVRIFILHKDIHWLLNSLIEFISFNGISVLWFLSSLYLTRHIVLNMLKMKKDRKIILLYSILMFLLARYLISFQELLPFSNRMVLKYLKSVYIMALRPFTMCFFLLFGYFIKDYVISFKYKKGLFLSVIPMLLIVLALSGLNGKVDIHNMIYGKSIILFFTAAIIGTFCILIASSHIEKTVVGSYLAYLGKYSLFIMCSHLYIPVISVVNSMIKLLQVNSLICFVILEIAGILLIEHVLIFLFGKTVAKMNRLLSCHLADKLHNFKF